MPYRVKAAAAVIQIGGSERYLYRGAIVPKATTNIDHLEAVGLIEKFEVTAVAIPDMEPVQVVSTNSQGTQEDTEEQGGGDEQPPTPPAQGGPGSSAEAWRSYAAKVGVDVPRDASRDDVITALEAAGKPTE